METIKMAHYSNIRLYDDTPKSVTSGLGCGQGCRLVLCVIHSTIEMAYAATVAQYKCTLLCLTLKCTFTGQFTQSS